MFTFKRLLLALALLCLMAVPARARGLNVACAVNFTSVMKELVTMDQSDSGNNVQCTFGSTAGQVGPTRCNDRREAAKTQALK